MSAQTDINSPASGGGETLEKITGIRPGLWRRAVPPYAAHPEELETADQGVRRLFFFDRAK